MEVERAIRKVDAEGRVIGKHDILQRMLADLKRQHAATPNAEDRWAIDKAIEAAEHRLTYRPKTAEQKAAEHRDAGSTPRTISRAASGDLAAVEGKTLAGYAAVFDELSLDLGGFRERLLPGAFQSTLAGAGDVLGLINHDADKVLGRTAAKTLTLKEDSRGLAFQLRPGGSQLWKDTLDQVLRRDMAKCSFAFAGPVDRFKVQPDGSVIREILDVGRLVDVSIVTTPAYEGTRVDIVTGRARSVHADIQRLELDLYLLRANDPSKKYLHLMK